jgi:hypothetical protein
MDVLMFEIHAADRLHIRIDRGQFGWFLFVYAALLTKVRYGYDIDIGNVPLDAEAT